MSKNVYTEDQLVEQPAIGLFGQLGWQTMSAMEETFGQGSTLGCKTKGEAVLVECLHLPRLPSSQIDVEAIAP